MKIFLESKDPFKPGVPFLQFINSMMSKKAQSLTYSLGFDFIKEEPVKESKNYQWIRVEEKEEKKPNIKSTDSWLKVLESNSEEAMEPLIQRQEIQPFHDTNQHTYSKSTRPITGKAFKQKIPKRRLVYDKNSKKR